MSVQASAQKRQRSVQRSTDRTRRRGRTTCPTAWTDHSAKTMHLHKTRNSPARGSPRILQFLRSRKHRDIRPASSGLALLRYSPRFAWLDNACNGANRTSSRDSKDQDAEKGLQGARPHRPTRDVSDTFLSTAEVTLQSEWSAAWVARHHTKPRRDAAAYLKLDCPRLPCR